MKKINVTGNEKDLKRFYRKIDYDLTTIVNMVKRTLGIFMPTKPFNIIIFPSKKEISKKHEEFYMENNINYKKFKKPAFYSSSRNTIYSSCYVYEEIIAHEIAHAMIKQHFEDNQKPTNNMHEILAMYCDRKFE